MRQAPSGGTLCFAWKTVKRVGVFFVGVGVYLFLFVCCCFPQNHEADSQISQQGFLFVSYLVFSLGACIVDPKSAQTTLKNAEFITQTLH